MIMRELKYLFDHFRPTFLPIKLEITNQIVLPDISSKTEKENVLS